MTYRWTHHDAPAVSELVLDGDFTHESFALAFDALAAWEGWDARRQILIRAGSGTGIGSLTLPDLIEHRAFMAAWNTQFRPGTGARTAFLVPDPIKHTLAQVWHQMVSRDWQVETGVFRDRDGALDWLAQAARDAA